MKIFVSIAIAVGCVFTSGCTSTKFTEYRGQPIVEGLGGTIRNVDGVDFWENGEPDKTYKIIGVIDDNRPDGLLVAGKDKAIAKLAREKGGDAVILGKTERQLAGIDKYGNARHRRMTKMLVVKYID